METKVDASWASRPFVWKWAFCGFLPSLPRSPLSWRRCRCTWPVGFVSVVRQLLARFGNLLRHTHVAGLSQWYTRWVRRMLVESPHLITFSLRVFTSCCRVTARRRWSGEGGTQKLERASRWLTTTWRWQISSAHATQTYLPTTCLRWCHYERIDDLLKAVDWL